MLLTRKSEPQAEIPNPVAVAAENLAAIDLAPHVARKSALQKSLTDTEAALVRAQGRFDELGVKLEQSAGVDASEIAHLLRNGGELPPDADEIRRERTLLLEGMKELRRDLNRINSELHPRTSEIDAEMARAVRPIQDDLQRRAEAAMQEIAEIYASAEALRRLCGAGERLVSELSAVLNAPSWGTFRLPSSIPVQAEIIAFENLEVVTFSKKYGVSKSVEFPKALS